MNNTNVTSSALAEKGFLIFNPEYMYHFFLGLLFLVLLLSVWATWPPKAEKKRLRLFIIEFSRLIGLEIGMLVCGCLLILLAISISPYQVSEILPIFFK